MNVKKYFLILLHVLSLFVLNIQADVIYRYAQEEDIDRILALINTASSDDFDRLVILPSPYREKYLKKAIGKRRVFIAQDEVSQNILAMLKLFVITDYDEALDIIQNELRGTGPGALLLTCQDVSPEYAFTDHVPEYNFLFSKELFSAQQDCFVYLGGELTRPDMRGHGYNTQLQAYAMAHIAEEIRALYGDDLVRVTLVYGLVVQNLDRTSHIVKRFSSFARQLTGLYHAREPQSFSFLAYRAIKPTFELGSDGSLVKLPGGTPGFGCFLSYELRH
jgi:hypothetical protein